MKVESIRQFKARLAGGFLLGPFSKTSDPALIEVMGHSGFDFVILDLEHGPNSVQHLQDLIRAAEVSGIFPIVRVKENNLSLIGEVLDIGAGGIQVPQVVDEETAREIIRTAKFSPEGARGVCRFVRAAEYSSTDRFQYFSEANETVVILQIEGKEALENLDQILAVPGIDIVFIGPYDLSQSLGIPGQVNNPLLIEKMTEIVRACLDHKVTVGTFVDTIEAARKWHHLGVRYISYSVDVGLFHEKCRADIKAIKGTG